MLFFCYLRMLPTQLEDLLQFVTPSIVKKGVRREPVSPVERITLTYNNRIFGPHPFTQDVIHGRRIFNISTNLFSNQSLDTGSIEIGRNWPVLIKSFVFGVYVTCFILNVKVLSCETESTPLPFSFKKSSHSQCFFVKTMFYDFVNVFNLLNCLEMLSSLFLNKYYVPDDVGHCTSV